MRIHLSPQRSDADLVVEKSGDILIINGEAFDFSPIPEGGTVPADAIPCDRIAGPVERLDGEIHITLILPHGSDPEPWQAFPDTIEGVPDGPVDLPVNTRVEVVEQPVEGGSNFITTTYRWHREPETTVTFIAIAEEEHADVEA